LLDPAQSLSRERVPSFSGDRRCIRVTQRNTTVLVGFDTDACNAQSAIGLRELGFRAVVIEGATYSSHDLQHQRGLARMSAPAWSATIARE
jgi:nicotinamidase-related amidase